MLHKILWYHLTFSAPPPLNLLEVIGLSGFFHLPFAGVSLSSFALCRQEILVRRDSGSMSSCWVRCSSTTYTCDCTSPPPPLLLQLRQVLPLIAPLLLGWFATLPGASAYRTDGCRIASHQATAFCASAPLIRLCKIEYTNIQTQFLFPKSQLPPKTLLSL
jgi:hypothetical protein